MISENCSFRTKNAAKYLWISASFLEKLRVRGGGPEYAKIGKIVVYARNDLDKYRDERKCRSTSDGAS
ncbi:MAG: DNA-binding protein [Azospirillum sp.]|nr:DNA-binding protein [Azospirillum sp.]